MCPHDTRSPTTHLCCVTPNLSLVETSGERHGRADYWPRAGSDRSSNLAKSSHERLKNGLAVIRSSKLRTTASRRFQPFAGDARTTGLDPHRTFATTTPSCATRAPEQTLGHNAATTRK